VNINNLDLTGKVIVVVEDDPTLRKYYDAMLRVTGAEILLFHTGKEFVQYISVENTNIDFVIMDFLIPLVNGIDCLRMFRKVNKNTPFIIITAYSSDEVKMEAFVAGCNEILIKPVFPEKVFSLLEKYLIHKIRITLPGRDY
jgi:DNA-binding response OmpR family regulator